MEKELSAKDSRFKLGEEFKEDIQVKPDMSIQAKMKVMSHKCYIDIRKWRLKPCSVVLCWRKTNAHQVTWKSPLSNCFCEIGLKAPYSNGSQKLLILIFKDIANDHAPFFVFENSRNFQRAVFIFWNLLLPYFFVQK